MVGCAIAWVLWGPFSFQSAAVKVREEAALLNGHDPQRMLEWALNRTENTSVDRRIEAAILASEVSNLENLEGFFLTPGYTLRLTFPYVSPELRSQAFVASERSDPAFVHVDEQDEPPESEEAIKVHKPASSVRPPKPQSNHHDSGDTLPFDQG